MTQQRTTYTIERAVRVALCALTLSMLLACDDSNDPTGPTPIPEVPATVPTLVSPGPGESLCSVCSGSTWRFAWSAVSGATHYHLQVLDPNGAAFIDRDGLGSTSFEYYQQTIMFGGTVHGWSWRVRAEVAGAWQAWSPAQPFEIDRAVPVLLSPAAGAELDNACTGGRDRIEWHFDWRNCLRADRYHLVVRHRGATLSLIDRDDLTRSELDYVSSGYIVDGNRQDWVWRVRAQLGGRWGEWSPDQTFDVELLNTDCR